MKSKNTMYTVSKLHEPFDSVICLSKQLQCEQAVHTELCATHKDPSHAGALVK